MTRTVVPRREEHPCPTCFRLMITTKHGLWCPKHGHPKRSPKLQPEGVYYCKGVRVPPPALLQGHWICLHCGDEVRAPVLRELRLPSGKPVKVPRTEQPAPPP